MTTTLHDIPRDGFGRPKVVPPGGGKPVAYTRATTFVSAIDDMYNLSRWQQRMVAKGLSMRPDLLLAVSATELADKKKLDAIVDDAREAAAASAAATIGTALHLLTEQIDRGQDVGVIPDAYKADLDAYRTATEPLTALMIEQFCVQDDLKIGGTPDRVVEYQGENLIADLKTGSIEYGSLRIAMQLAVYAHSRSYDHVTGKRTDLPNVDQDKAIVIHLPAGSGTCELCVVDIRAGWEAVQVCAEVRKWRSRKGFIFPMPDAAPMLAMAPTPQQAIEEEIASAPTLDELTRIWMENADVWCDSYTELARARKVLLEGNVA